MDLVLWHIELSHYSEKARWALDFKRLPYELRTPMPGLHGLSAAWLTRGAQRRLPVMRLDGRNIGDSTAIIAALERHRPDPPLYPSDPDERARALGLEEHFDEALGPALRCFTWHHTLPDHDATVAALFTRPSPVRERLLRASAPVASTLVRRDYGIDDATAALARKQVVEAMDTVEAELGPSGHLAGDAFSVADLTAAALFTPLLAPPGRPYAPSRLAAPVLELREELSARPGGEWVAETYARHRGTRAPAPA
ncbi:MAG: glutathione S-transferase family protein [Solirubrobacteraceae bacterium]